MSVNNSFSNNGFGAGPSNIVTSGAMSFDASMHGNSQPMSLFNDPCFLDLSQTTAAQIASLQAKLNQQLGPEYISTRPGPGGGPKLVYAEGWKIINLANEVFGFNGWSSNLVNLATDFCDFNEESRRYNVGVTAIVRVTLRDGVFHEDVGYGLLENAKSKAQALDKCKKEAVTDGLKRTLRNFGNLLGNCLYDKAYTNEIVKVKVQPPKFDKSQLHRRPEFAEPKSEPGLSKPSSTNPLASASTSAAASSSKQPVAGSSNNNTTVKSEPNPKRSSSLSSNTREQVRNIIEGGSTGIASTTTSTPVPKPKSAGPKPPITGLSTPITTPAVNQGLSLADRKVQFTESPSAARAAPPQQPRQNHPLQQSHTAQAETNAENNEDDDSFSYAFGSDDDAFLATVDLGEGDLGRPIDFGEGLDVNIDQLTTTPFLDDSVRESSSSVPPLKQRKQEQPPLAKEDIPPPAPILKNINTSRSSIFSGRGPLSSSSLSGLGPNKPPLDQQTWPFPRPNENQAPSSHLNESFTTPSFENANRTSIPSSSSSRRGGFSFPSEARKQSQQPQFPSSVGAKRNHEAMRSSAAANSVQTSRRPVQGMGLMNAQGSNAARQTLGNPDMAEGGDVKRLKR